MEVIMKKMSEIRPYERNPRRNDDAVKYVQASIEEFGFKVPIVIDANGVIVAGHTRFKAAKKLGMEIADLEAIIEAKKIQRIHEAAVIERYISEVPDAYTRLIFRLRYIDCMSWNKIAMTLRGTTADAARKSAERYIEKSDKAD